MSAAEPPPLSSARFTAAARSIWALAAMGVVHTGTALLTAPAEKIASIGAEAIAAMIGVNVAVAVAFAWLGVRVRSGRSAAGACAGIALYGFMGLAAVASTIGTKSGYQGTPTLVVVQCAFGLAWIVALTLAIRAWTTPPSGR